MPILARIFLEQCSSQFLELLSQLQKNCDTLNPHFIKSFSFVEPETIIASEEDEDAMLIAPIYLLFFELMNQSLQTKAKFEATLPSEIEITDREKKHILFESMLKLKTEKPLVWLQLFSRSQHRPFMYFLINTAILNPEWAPLSICKDIIQSLLDTSSCDAENLGLKYLNFLINLVKNPRQVLINQNIANPYFHIHFQLQFADSQDKLSKIASISLPFSDQIPSFIHKLIHNGFVYMFLKKTLLMNMAFPELLHFCNTLPAGFLSPHNHELKFETADDPLELVHRFYYSLKTFTRNYTLHLEQPFYTKTWFGYLSFYLLQTFNAIPSENKLSYKSLNLLIHCCEELIITNTPQYWSLYLSSTQEFWKICGRLITYPGLVSMEFIHFTNFHLITIAENLATYKLWNSLKLFIDNFLERLQFYSSPAKPEWLSLILLYQNLSFFQHFLFIPATSTAEDAETLIDTYFSLNTWTEYSADPTISIASLKKYYPLFSQSLIESMLEKLVTFGKHLNLSTLSSKNLDKLYELQKKVYVWLRNIDAKKTDIQVAKQAIKEDELLEIRLKTLSIDTLIPSPKKSPKKTIPAAGAPSRSEPTISLPQPSLPDTRISHKEIPGGLIKLAHEILTALESKVVLNGSAVTNLYLKRPNPNDYDCLVFGIDLPHLKTFLDSRGYIHNQIVGKTYPVLKLMLEDEGQKLEIDMSTITELKPTKFTEQMAEILSNRDFKLNALYLEIQLDLEFFEIKGFDHALHSINLKQISAVENKKRRVTHHIFAEDPLRAFRLVKILLQYPDFQPDGTLNRILKLTPLSSILPKFIQDEINQARIGTYLDSLFLRFDPMQIIHVLGHYKIIEGLTHIPYSLLKTYLPLFETYLATVKPRVYSPHFFSPRAVSSPSAEFYYHQDQQRLAYTYKLSLFQFFTTVYFIEHQKHSWEHWPASGLVHKLKPRDQINIDMIYYFIHTQEKDGLAIDPNLLELIESALQQKRGFVTEKKTAAVGKSLM